MALYSQPFFGGYQTKQTDVAVVGNPSKTIFSYVYNAASSGVAAATNTVAEEMADDTDAYGRPTQFPGFTPRS